MFAYFKHFLQNSLKRLGFGRKMTKTVKNNTFVTKGLV